MDALARTAAARLAAFRHAHPAKESTTGRDSATFASAAALDRFLSAEEGSSDYETNLSALLEREKELLAGVAGQEKHPLTI